MSNVKIILYTLSLVLVSCISSNQDGKMSNNENKDKSNSHNKTDANYDYNRETLENIVFCDDSKETIRIDLIGEQKWRYTSWNKPKKIIDQPDLVLYGSKFDYGSSGNFSFSFNNGIWDYTLKNVIVGISENPNDYGLFLDVHNDGKLISTSKMQNLK